jgi:hypothetical protein
VARKSLRTTGLAVRFTGIFIVTAFTGSPPASAGFLLRLLSDPEYGGDMFLQNISWFSPDYMAYIPQDRTLHNAYTYEGSHILRRCHPPLPKLYLSLSTQCCPVLIAACDKLCPPANYAKRRNTLSGYSITTSEIVSGRLLKTCLGYYHYINLLKSFNNLT